MLFMEIVSEVEVKYSDPTALVNAERESQGTGIQTLCNSYDVCCDVSATYKMTLVNKGIFDRDPQGSCLFSSLTSHGYHSQRATLTGQPLASPEHLGLNGNPIGVHHLRISSSVNDHRHTRVQNRS